MPLDQVTYRVPGTTSNLGPGFDCLGAALSIYNEVTVTRLARAEGALNDNPFFEEVGQCFFSRSGLAPFAFDCAVSGEIPRSRGLGSSATVRVGIMAGLNALCGEPLTSMDLFALCTELEGHPDNAAPTVFGGFNACQDFQPPLRFSIGQDLKFVLLIPAFEISTPASRQALPAEIPHRDAVRSLASAARITAAFASHDYPALAGAFADYLHQPYRAPLIPCLFDVIKAATEAGALGGFLSGSGSTIIALTLRQPEGVAAAMLRASGLGEQGARTLVLEGDNSGCLPVPSPAPAPQAAPPLKAGAAV